MRLSPLVQGIQLSITLALDARAKEMAAAGRDVLNMAVGEPDFPTPAGVMDAARAKVDSGQVRYTPAAGALSLILPRWMLDDFDDHLLAQAIREVAESIELR